MLFRSAHRPDKIAAQIFNVAAGVGYADFIAAIQTAMLAGLPYPKLRDAAIAHMTTAEGLGLLLGNVPPRPL